MYEDLMEFLDQSHYDIVLIQETKLRRVHDSHMDLRWLRHHCPETCWCHDTDSALNKTNAHEVRHDAVIPGRLLRVRVPLVACSV